MYLADDHRVVLRECDAVRRVFGSLLLVYPGDFAPAYGHSFVTFRFSMSLSWSGRMARCFDVAGRPRVAARTLCVVRCPGDEARPSQRAASRWHWRSRPRARRSRCRARRVAPCSPCTPLQPRHLRAARSLGAYLPLCRLVLFALLRSRLLRSLVCQLRFVLHDILQPALSLGQAKKFAPCCRRAYLDASQSSGVAGDGHQ